MRAPSFWWRDDGVAPRLLAPLAAVYGAVAARRLKRKGREVGVPVLCIGNLTQGGAGKTPAALAAAHVLLSAGERPVFLTRGYGGKLAGPVRVDPARHGAADVGDEPLLLARVAPTIVARDRVAGAELARTEGNVVVMDDGFQNPSLEKRLAVLAVDGRRGIGNGRVFPAGPLRAPLDDQLARAHAIIIVGEASGAASVIAECTRRGLPVLHGRLEPDESGIAALAGHQVLAFAGIGDPEKFFATLAAAGIEAPVRRSFADHHRYSEAEAAELLRAAEQAGLTLLTTEKDLVRIAGAGALATLANNARALPVRLVLDDEARWRRLLLDGLMRSTA